MERTDDNEELTQDLISSFLYIPYEVLLGEIFPRLSIKTINKLCTVNTLFNDLCNDETLWKIKVTNEYSTLVNNKPFQLSWRDYYRSLISRTVPVYYHGDYITMANFLVNDLMGIVPSIAQIYTGGAQTIQIAFINSVRQIVVGIQYPDMIMRNFTPDDREIVKIIIIDDAPLDLSEPLIALAGQLPKRRRGRNPTNLTRRISKIHIPTSEDAANSIVYNELISLFGNPPIYGLYRDNEYSSTTMKSFSIIERHVQDLNHDARKIVRGKLCSTISRSDLINLLQRLNVMLDPTANYQKEELCGMVEQALTEIGHIV